MYTVVCLYGEAAGRTARGGLGSIRVATCCPLDERYYMYATAGDDDDDDDGDDYSGNYGGQSAGGRH
jgi:hypothetical protein